MLSHYFSKLLKDQGYYSIHIGREKLDLQTLAVKMLDKGYGIMDEKREGNTVLEVEGIRLLKGRGSEKSDCIFRKGHKVS
jgi:Trm5-related predicted tRNA methylase